MTLKCSNCGLIKWRKVTSLMQQDEPEDMYQCENCKRVIVTVSIEGEGEI